MAGFLDSKDRVIDLVLTETGKALLLRGELSFNFWVPYDDEVDYAPIVRDARADQSSALRAQELTESPLITEARSGYRGLNLAAADLMNVNRPMYSAPPGTGKISPLPLIAVSPTGGLSCSITQRQTVVTGVAGQSDTLIDRYGATEGILSADYSLGSYPAEHRLEGFLITVYRSGTLSTDDLGNETGGFREVLPNRDSSGSIVFRNDLKINNYTP